MRKTFTPNRYTYRSRNFSGNSRPQWRRPYNARPNYDLASVISAQSKSASSAYVQEEYVPVNKFEDFEICGVLKRNILGKQYTAPTPIQDKTIPAILSGRDVIGIANTGTGKTAAFLIPLIEKVSRDKSAKALIVTPTRELALQIHQELMEFARGMGIYDSLCVGGMSIKRQRFELLRNPNFVIGTPGRIKDLINQRILELSKFNNVVLDEADRMVDIGFIVDIKYFISLLAPIRQSLFFSATISPKVEDIMKSFVKDPVTISVKERDTAQNVSQEIIRVSGTEQKVNKLHDLLTSEGFEKVLIFGRTKRGVQRLTDELNNRGLRAGVIHGNKRQNERMRILDMFRKNQIRILLATDVASRGLDIDGVSHVINYDMPASYEDYIHRIGRTGRANKQGTALTFVA